jgi:hypothetical protein
MFHTTIGVDPGKVTGWCVAVDHKPVAWGQGATEDSVDAVLAELKGLDEPVCLFVEAAYQGRFGAGVQVAYRAGLVVGMLRRSLPEGSIVMTAPATQWRKALGWSGGKEGRKHAKSQAAKVAFDLTQDKEMRMPTREHVAEAICMAVAAFKLSAELQNAE